MALGENFLLRLSEKIKEREELRQSGQQLPDSEKFAKMRSDLHKKKVASKFRTDSIQPVATPDSSLSMRRKPLKTASKQPVNAAKAVTEPTAAVSVQEETKALDRRSRIRKNFNGVTTELVLMSYQHQTDEEFLVSLTKLEKEWIGSKAA